MLQGTRELSAAIKANHVVLLKNFCDDLPTWSDVVQHIEVSTHRDEYKNVSKKPFEVRAINDLMLRRTFYFMAYVREEDLDIDKHFTKLGKIRALLQLELQKKLRPTAAYVNLATGEMDWPMHRDPEDSLYIQMEGECTWVLEDSEYRLTRGDAIYFPAMENHAVIANTPRAAMIFAIE